MENLLKTILLECKKNKLMFRANAYELWNHGCETMIVPWGYDIKALQETFKAMEFDTPNGNIQILHEDDVQTHKQLIKNIKKEFTDTENYEYYDDNRVPEIKAMSDEEVIKEFPMQYYCGNHQIMWECYNDGEECLSDWTTGLDKYFDLHKLSTAWAEKFQDFVKGLS